MPLERVEDICSEFVTGKIFDASSFGDGHINDTFRIKAEEGTYVCQRVRKSIDVGILEHNYLLYSEACRRADILYPCWMKTREGMFFYKDPNGDHWRAYPFIEGEILSFPLTKEALLSCGKGLARLHKCLQTLSDKPRATYPMLHDLTYYHDRYLRVIQRDLSGEERDESLERLIRSRIKDFTELALDRSRVIHGDPKLANILFQGDRVTAFLDYDTVMQGSLLEDVADCVRSCCVADGKLDEAAADILLQGYLSENAGLLSEGELKRLPDVIRKLFFELGLRYYTDAIAKTKKFKEKYPGYLLEKARGYFNKLTNA